MLTRQSGLQCSACSAMSSAMCKIGSRWMTASSQSSQVGTADRGLLAAQAALHLHFPWLSNLCASPLWAPELHSFCKDFVP